MLPGSPARLTPENRWRAVLLALALYLVWTATTYLLEGRIRTLLRPDATAARVTYAVIANLLVGLVGAIAALQHLNRWRVLDPQTAGFQGRWHALGSIGAGLAIGFAIYVLQPSPVWHPGVLANGFAQVFTVSTAEVLVCWAVVGSLSRTLLQPFGSRVAFTGAVLIASVLFGLYHFAHSPPFNAPGMVLRLTAVGLGTSAFFFVTRNVYGTIAFHNVLGLYGVTQSLASHGRLASLEQLQPSLLLTAGATLLLLVLADAMALRR